MIAKRVDDNQEQIMRDLRKVGCEVTSIASVGKGCPDLLISHEGYWFVFEIKDGSKVKSAQKLTKDEKRWIERQKAPVHIITCTADALRVFNEVIYK